MRLKSVALACLMAFGLIASGITPAFAYNPNTDGDTPTGVVPGYAIVTFAQAPLAEWPGAARQKNGKLDFSAGANGQYQASLAQVRNAFKQWLQSTKSPAQIIRQYDTVLDGVAVQLNGATLDSLRGGPSVTVVEPSLSYSPTMDRSLSLINAQALWGELGGAANAGAGIKVGVIDAGIDQTHPFLTDNSLTPPTGFPKYDPGQIGFTSKKVIVARVYYTGRPGLYTAEAKQEHGTHVSGTIAGVPGQTPTQFPITGTFSGVAPKAFLGNYNVFPGGITNATSHDIAQAIEDAVKDGMDVINMSLGGGINGYQDQLTVATNRAVEAGVVVAVAAGNSGPGVNTVESPGQAALAITAAASTNSRWYGVSVTVAGHTYGAAAGQFNAFDPPVTAPLANWNNPADTAGATKACVGLAGTPYVGKIVLLDRGGCTFAVKVNNAAAAGAEGVLVVNSVTGDPIPMAGSAAIPAVMVSKDDGTAIRANAGATVIANGTVFTPVPTAANKLADFSSRGPTNLLDIKPDVAAPGVNILSSIPDGKYAVFQGTSMATPHIAGSAALLRQQHPDWTPAQVKSALVNSANEAAALGTKNPMNRGSGIIDLAAAGTLTATLDPATLSFRKIEPTSGQSKTIDVTITNTSGTDQTYALSAAFAFAQMSTYATVSVSPASVSIAKGQYATVSVTVDTTQTSPSGQYYGDFIVSGTGPTLHAPFWFAIRTYTDAGPLQ